MKIYKKYKWLNRALEKTSTYSAINPGEYTIIGKEGAYYEIDDKFNNFIQSNGETKPIPLTEEEILFSFENKDGTPIDPSVLQQFNV